MKIDYNKIHAGDRVQIANGDWFEVEIGLSGRPIISTNPTHGYTLMPEGIIGNFITGYKPAEAKTEAEGLTNPTPAHEAQPVGEASGQWLTYPQFENWYERAGAMNWGDAHEFLETILEGMHGHPPIVRTFNGEPASEWGLEEDDFVLWWHVLNYWTTCRYSGLAKGDQWMMQLPAPKGGSDED